MFDLAQIRQVHQTFASQHALMVQEQLEFTGQYAVDQVVQRPRFKPHTGKLGRSTEYRVLRASNGKIVRIRNTAKYARFVDEGTKPHVIRARRRKALRFQYQGRIFYRRSVNHPGGRATQFLLRATGAAFVDLERRLESSMTRVAKRF